MAQVVFLRGVNVGGRKTFQPARLAQELAHLQVVNHGAAGTFMVHGKVSPKSLRDAFLRKLPFRAEVMICSAAEITALVDSKPFGEKPPTKDERWFVSVLARPLRARPRLPVQSPATGGWEVRVVRVAGKFALSLWRRGRAGVYPNQVVEKAFGVPATTRNWDTIISVCDKLQEQTV